MAKQKCKVHIEEMSCKAFEVEFDPDLDEDPTEIALAKYKAGEFVIEDVVPTCVNTMVEYEDGTETGWSDHYIF